MRILRFQFIRLPQTYDKSAISGTKDFFVNPKCLRLNC